MNFGDKIKSEIISKQIKDVEEKRCFLSGVIRGAGSLFTLDGELGLDFFTTDENIAIAISTYLKTIFNYDVREVSVSQDKLNKKDRFIISITGDKSLDVLNGLGIIKTVNGENQVNFDFYDEKYDEEKNFKAFIRGLFISSGRCTVPNEREDSKTKYHLEISFSHNNTALSTAERLEKNGIITKITRRKDEFVLYIKSAESIKDFLAFLALPLCVIKLTDIVIKKELINDVNRRKNCDLGNVNRQIEASSKCILAIEKIEKTIGLSQLKDELLIVAKARKENPDITVNELALKLGISKSCLNHRLRRIIELANTKED